MKCLNCGLEYSNEYSNCPNCGAAAPIAEPVSLNPVADRVTSALKDNLFLALCVAFTVSTGLSVIAGSINVIYILLTIFLWVAYSKAINNSDSSDSLRCISGTVYAQYIIDNVAAILIMVCGVIFTATFLNANNLTEMIEKTMSDLPKELKDVIPKIESYGAEELSILLRLIGPILIVIGILTLLINFFSIRKIHKFIKSTYLSMSFRAPFIEKINATRNWLIVFAVFYGLATFYTMVNILSLLINGGVCVSIILAVIIINKYFLDINKTV